MNRYLISIDRALPYVTEAFNSFDAWEAAANEHPTAGRIEVFPLPPLTTL